jgi:beta-glucosidase
VSWLPGQEAGNGLADVLFGVVNPYARLPVTFPNKDNEGDLIL